ncbi:MAG: hypothetical protein FGM27_05675 [Candidatus Omnitrophica bacterium]|nr:hypothetical protein [Candidatus Omnitrophota bacterium]
MKKIWLVLSALILSPSILNAASSHILDSSQRPAYLFVQTAKSGSFDGIQITLNDVSPTVYFSDRPYRVAGHISTEQFIAGWFQGPGNFEADPPNATLSVFNPDGTLLNTVIEVTEPVYKDGAVRYTVRTLSGELPKDFQTCSIFISAGEDIGELPAA